MPSLVVITSIWAIGLYGLDKVQLSREDQKPAWAINKDLFQKALYRRDWYLKREEETFGKHTNYLRYPTPMYALVPRLGLPHASCWSKTMPLCRPPWRSPALAALCDAGMAKQ